MWVARIEDIDHNKLNLYYLGFIFSQVRRSLRKRDYYQVLNVRKDATRREIKAAFRKLALRYHPDVSKSSDSGEDFKEIVEAYSILSDDVSRMHYDRHGLHDAKLTRMKNRNWTSNIALNLDLSPFEKFWHSMNYYSNVVDLLLTPKQRQTGGVFEVSKPILRKCEKCGGRGYADDSTRCEHCLGKRYIKLRSTISVSVPAEVDVGHVLRIRIENLLGNSVDTLFVIIKDK